MKERIIPAAESTGAMHITDIDALQAHLLRLSDMAASGACLPQIIHELNSPLSSIRANAANSVHALASLRQDFQDIFPQLTSEQQALFWAMVERAWQYAHHLSTSEERKLSRVLETTLETYRVNNAEEVAETLVEMEFTKILRRCCRSCIRRIAGGFCKPRTILPACITARAAFIPRSTAFRT